MGIAVMPLKDQRTAVAPRDFPEDERSHHSGAEYMHSAIRGNGAADMAWRPAQPKLTVKTKQSIAAT